MSAAQACLPSSRQGGSAFSLLHLKRQMIVLSEAVDWSRLRNVAVWPPAARAAWVQAVLTSPTLRNLQLLLDQLESVFVADDAAAAIATRTEVGRANSDDDTPAAWQWIPARYLDTFAPGRALEIPTTTASVAARLRNLGALVAPVLLN